MLDIDTCKAVVFWSHFSGLGNRLRALIGYQAMASVLDVPFYLCWEPNFECDTEFTHLFKLPDDIKLISVHEKSLMESNQSAYINDANPYYVQIWRDQLTEEIVSWAEFHMLALRFLNQLEPVPEIAKKVHDFTTEYDLSRRYGIHIRMTDNIKAYKWWKENSPYFREEFISDLGGFIQFIDDISTKQSEAKFFLSTDNQAVEAYLIETYPTQLITYSKQYQSDQKKSFSFRSLRFREQLQRTSAIQDALVEMLLLSQCCEIAGTYFSTFSEMSAIIGRKKKYVVHGKGYKENNFVKEMIL